MVLWVTVYMMHTLKVYRLFLFYCILLCRKYGVGAADVVCLSIIMQGWFYCAPQHHSYTITQIHIRINIVERPIHRKYVFII